MQYPVSDACEEAQATKKIGVDVYQWLREVCAATLIQAPINVRKTQLSGLKLMVTHKPKVNIAK